MQAAMDEAVSAKATGLVPLDTLAATIKASIAAGDKALDKAEQHYKAAGIHLLEAKKRLPVEQPGKMFTAYIIGECRMGTSRAYELIAIAEGRTTQEEIRAKGRERASKFSEKNKSARDSVSNVKPASTDPVSEQRDIVMLAMKDATLDDWTKLAKCATEMKSARDFIKQKADRAETRAKSDSITKPAPRKLTPDQLKARRRNKADSKTHDDYFKQFGPVYGVLDRARYNLMAASLASGVDQLADVRREQEEHGRTQAEYVRDETARRAALNKPLLAPITPEKEQAYTRLIKTRTLYEGACGLSWQEYFEYREAHFECEPLTRGDLSYANMWTACAVIPEMDASTITENALRERAARLGYKVRRRGAEYNLTRGEDDSNFGGSLEGVIDWLDFITPVSNETLEALAA